MLAVPRTNSRYDFNRLNANVCFEAAKLNPPTSAVGRSATDLLLRTRHSARRTRDCRRAANIEPGRSRARSSRRSILISWAEPAHQAPRGGEAPDARDGHRRSPRLPLNANATDIADRKNPGYAGLKQLGRARERRLWRYPALRWRLLFLNFGMPGHWLRIVQVCVAPVLRHQLFAPKSASAIERSDRACLSAPRVTRL